MKIFSFNEGVNEVILLVGSQEVLYEVDVTVSSPPTSPISSCVSPDGTLTIVPNPIIQGSFQKPYSGNGSVFLINVGGTPVDYQIYGVEEYCDLANSTNSSSSLYSFPNLTDYDDLCSDVNESGDFDVSWDGINGSVVLCSFNTINVSVSSDGLSKGEYEAHLVVDSDFESGAEGMTISLSTLFLIRFDVLIGKWKNSSECSFGSKYCCAFLDDDSLKAWLRNSIDQLGQGNQDTLGDEPGEM